MKLNTYLTHYVEKEHPGWRALSELDKSEAYEIDVMEIWQSEDGRIQYVSASGCSCWDGEYSTEDFDSIDALVAGLTKEDAASGYNPTPAGLAELAAEARKFIAMLPMRGDYFVPRGEPSEADIKAAKKLLLRMN